MTYTPIYSDIGRIQNRVPQIDTNMIPQILIYQQYIDTTINNTLRSVLGMADKNNMIINLPLVGDYDVIDIQQNQISLHLDFEVQMAADDCVIAKFRQDTAENDEKVKNAQMALLDIIRTKYGGAISVDQDFSTDYLAADKLTDFNGVPIQLFDGSGVLLWK